MIFEKASSVRVCASLIQIVIPSSFSLVRLQRTMKSCAFSALYGHIEPVISHWVCMGRNNTQFYLWVQSKSGDNRGILFRIYIQTILLSRGRQWHDGSLFCTFYRVHLEVKSHLCAFLIQIVIFSSYSGLNSLACLQKNHEVMCLLPDMALLKR
jgi:hypothetical protein